MKSLNRMTENLHKELIKGNSRSQTLRIANEIGVDGDQFAALMDLFFCSELRIAQRAASVVSACADQHPFLIEPYLEKLVVNLETETSDAVKRNTVRILQSQSIPDKLLGQVTEVCFRLLRSRQEPIAVRVFSMSVLLNVVRKIPELRTELVYLLEDELPYGSAGFISRATKVLKALRHRKTSW